MGAVQLLSFALQHLKKFQGDRGWAKWLGDQERLTLSMSGVCNQRGKIGQRDLLENELFTIQG